MSFDAGLILGLTLGSSGTSPPQTENDSDYEKWLSLPEPADNQAVFLVRVVDGYMTCVIYTDYPDDSISQNIGYSINWGDGTTETYNNQLQAPTHTYSSSGEYIVIFTNICGSNNYALPSRAATHSWWIMGKYGNAVYPNQVGDTHLRTMALALYRYLRYIRLSPKTHFWSGLFSGCYSLRKIEYDGNVQLYANMFSQCYNLNFEKMEFASVTEIPESCFSSCYSLKKISFSGCTAVNKNAFVNCYGLTNVLLKDCTSIGENAFENCYNLANVEMSECLLIGNASFRHNRMLRNIILPKCTTVGEQAFYACYGLTSAEFSAGCTFGTNCFQNCYALYPKPDGSI